MTKQTLILTGLMAGLFFQTAYAAETPKRSVYDGRIQSVNYNPNDVVNIKAKPGFVTMIQLQEGETINSGDSASLAMGYGKAWGLTSKGNNIYFKPLNHQPTTNLLFTTNKKRRYALHLSMAGSKSQPTYILAFNYPGDARYKQLLEEQKQVQAAAVLRSSQSKNKAGGDYNRNYWGKGKKSLAPTSVYDDGRFTYLRYDDAKSLPAVFRVNSDGTEAAVNSHVEGDTLVIHETAEKFVLRLGKSVLGIENRSYDAKGKFNMTGSTKGRTVRLRKGKK